MRVRWNVRDPLLARVLPGAVRMLAAIVALALAGGLLYWGVDLARRIGGARTAPVAPDAQQQLSALQGELTRLAMERDQLTLALEKAATTGKAQEQQANQIKALEGENSRLIDDLSSFGAALPSVTGIEIRRAQAELVAPTQLHYRLLVTAGGKKAPSQFVGQLQLLVTVLAGGKPTLLTFPHGEADAAGFAIKLGQMQRLEGTLSLPAAVTIQSIEARVLERGLVRSAHPVALKGDAHVVG